MRKAILDDPYEEKDDEGNILLGDVIFMQNLKMIEDQIISDELSNMLIEELFII